MSNTEAVSVFNQSIADLRNTLDKSKQNKQNLAKAEEFRNINPDDRRAKLISQDIESGNLTGSQGQQFIEGIDNTSPNAIASSFMKKITDPNTSDIDRVKAMRGLKIITDLTRAFKQGAKTSGDGEGGGKLSEDRVTAESLRRFADTMVANGTWSREESDLFVITIGTNLSKGLEKDSLMDSRAAKMISDVKLELDKKKGGSTTTTNKAKKGSGDDYVKKALTGSEE